MAERLRPYRVILHSRLRSQTTYRSGFGLDVLGNVGIGLLEFAEIWVIFSNVDMLGGLDLPAAFFVFALANLAFSLADMLVGHVDLLPSYLRAGTLDAYLLRPLPVLAQLVTSDVSLRRLGRTAVALVVLGVAVPSAGVVWSPATLVLFLVTPVAGTGIYCGLFVAAAGAQFWLVEGREFGNAFTYGGAYTGAYPASVLHVALRVFFTFVVPASFTAYLPTLALLDLPGPPFLPSWLGWCTPVMAALTWVWALLLWRAGLRHYTGTGS